jgi:hypothetical protein
LSHIIDSKRPNIYQELHLTLFLLQEMEIPTNTYNRTKPKESYSLSNSPTTHTLLQTAATSLDR